MLEVTNLYCGYGRQDVVKGVSLSATAGENVCIIGPNGCGKTTLLKAIANLLPYRGSVTIDGVELREMKRRDIASRLALMTQITTVYFPYTVYETVALGRYVHLKGVFGSLTKDDEAAVLSCIERVGLLDEKDKLITELSGGQLQRVFLARVFAQDPDILLLDEPTNHLDLKHQIELLEYLKEWSCGGKKAVVGVLHDLNLVQTFASKVLLMSGGKLVAEGAPDEIFRGGELEAVYGIDIKQWMAAALKRWC